MSRGRRLGPRRYALTGGRFSAFKQKSAGDAQRALGLLHIDGLGEHEVRAHAIRLGDACLAFNHSDGQRTLIEARTARALDEKSRVLLVFAINHDRIVMLRHDVLYGGEGIADTYNGEFEFSEKLACDPGEF